MGKKILKEEKRIDKKLALYQAVMDLLIEGWDLDKIKVIDITNKAGIGKGTAYDYCSNKEELIIEALLFFAQKTIRVLLEKMKAVEGMRSKLSVLINAMLENEDDRKCTMKCTHIIIQNERFRDEMLKTCNRAMEDEEHPIILFRYLIDCGRKEGVISADLPQSYLEMTMISKLIGFGAYLEKKEKITDCLPEQMGKLVCDGILTEITGMSNLK